MDINQIFVLISKIRRDSAVFLENELKNQGLKGLIPSHGAILAALFNNNGQLKMKEIADITKRDKSTITYLVNILNQYGYVTKKKGAADLRETYIQLTDKALNIEDNINQISKNLINTAYVGFTDEQQHLLLQLLTKLDNNITLDV